MVGVSIKNYKIHNLQKEYNRYSNMFFNTQNHITKLFNTNVLSISDRNQHLKHLSDLLRQMNNKYNKYMTETCENDSEDNNESDKLLLGDIIPNVEHNIDTNFDDISCLLKFRKMLDLNEEKDELSEDPFESINSELQKICSKVGFYNIFEGLDLIVGEHFDKLYTPDTLSYLNIYNRLFVPVRYHIKENVEESQNYFFKQIEPLNEILLDNCADFYIKKPNNTDQCIVMTGYFNYDSLHIVVKTSQICNNFIYQKKKEIEKFISDREDINDRFKKLYLRHISIRDIIVMSKEEFSGKMEKSYQKYRHLTKLTFINFI